MFIKYGFSDNLVRLTGMGMGLWLATLAPSLAVTFIPPEDHPAPTSSDGGASRGNIRFIPPQDNSAPAYATGGASRIGFIPPPDNSAPDYAAGGASRVGFTPPPENPTPQDTVSGASREGAVSTTAMMAVTPSSLYGLTILARPTVMAYLPETKAHTAIFSLKDETQSVIYRQIVPLDESDGILRVTLGEDAPALAVDQYYQWFVTLQTEDYITPGSPYVTAWIKRVDMASVGQMDVLTGLAKAKALAQAGVWYDAAEQLAELQLNPQTQDDTAANWTEFLTSVGLDGLLERSFL